MPQPHSSTYYNELGNHLVQHLRNQFSNIEIVKVGSRSRGDHKRTSDLDYHFCLQGATPNKQRLYESIVDLFEQNAPRFRGERIQ